MQLRAATCDEQGKDPGEGRAAAGKKKHSAKHVGAGKEGDGNKASGLSPEERCAELGLTYDFQRCELENKRLAARNALLADKLQKLVAIVELGGRDRGAGQQRTRWTWGT